MRHLTISRMSATELRIHQTQGKRALQGRKKRYPKSPRNSCLSGHHQEHRLLRYRSRIDINAKRQPDHHREHADPANLASEMADLLIEHKNTPLIEENGPVAFIGVDEREDERTGVGHVGTNIEKVFEEPEEREGQAVGLPMVEEKGRTKKRNDKLTEGATKNHDGVAEPSEEVMSSLMDGEIHEIEEEKPGIISPGIEKEKEI